MKEFSNPVLPRNAFSLQKVRGATLSVIFQPIGGEAVEIGTVTTDGEGNAGAEVGILDVENTAGLFFIGLTTQTDDPNVPPVVTKYFVTGFSTNPDLEQEEEPDFSEASTMTELNQTYKATVQAEKARVGAQIQALKQGLAQTQATLKKNYEERKKSLSHK